MRIKERRGWVTSTPFRLARSRCGSELLLPFARPGAMRLSGAAARLATLLGRASAQSPRRAAAGLLRHAGSATLLPATLRAWTSALLGLRRRPAPLLRATTALLRAWTSALLGLRRRAATLFGATAALLRRARGSALLGAASTLRRHNGFALLRPSLRGRGWLLAARLATRSGRLTSLFRRRAGRAFRARPSLFRTT